MEESDAKYFGTIDKLIEENHELVLHMEEQNEKYVNDLKEQHRKNIKHIFIIVLCFIAFLSWYFFCAYNGNYSRNISVDNKSLSESTSNSSAH